MTLRSQWLQFSDERNDPLISQRRVLRYWKHLTQFNHSFKHRLNFLLPRERKSAGRKYPFETFLPRFFLGQKRDLERISGGIKSKLFDSGLLLRVRIWGSLYARLEEEKLNWNRFPHFYITRCLTFGFSPFLEKVSLIEVNWIVFIFVSC